MVTRYRTKQFGPALADGGWCSLGPTEMNVTICLYLYIEPPHIVSMGNNAYAGKHDTVPSAQSNGPHMVKK
jgi:hypothetical protein